MFALSVGLPLLTLVLSTLMKMPGRFTLDNFTLDYWIGTGLNTVALQTGILLSPDLWNAAWNSLCDRRPRLADLGPPRPPRRLRRRPHARSARSAPSSAR